MRTLYLTDAQRRDSPVAFESVTQPSEVRYRLDGGDNVQSVKVIKTTFNCNYQAVSEKAKEQGKEIVDLLIAEDPEIDFQYTGKISTKTKTIYLDEQENISYNLRFQEQIFEPGGEERETRAYERPPANMGKDVPLVWTGKFIPIAKAVKKFAFSKVYQVRHTNGLTYDFLHEMAATLEKKKALMLMGAGPNGKQPLRLTRGALPYRAFLMGRTQGETYRLTMHLSNLELKQ